MIKLNANMIQNLKNMTKKIKKRIKKKIKKNAIKEINVNFILILNNKSSNLNKTFSKHNKDIIKNNNKKKKNINNFQSIKKGKINKNKEINNMLNNGRARMNMMIRLKENTMPLENLKKKIGLVLLNFTHPINRKIIIKILIQILILIQIMITEDQFKSIINYIICEKHHFIKIILNFNYYKIFNLIKFYGKSL